MRRGQPTPNGQGRDARLHTLDNSTIPLLDRERNLDLVIVYRLFVWVLHFYVTNRGTIWGNLLPTRFLCVMNSRHCTNSTTLCRCGSYTSWRAALPFGIHYDLALIFIRLSKRCDESSDAATENWSVKKGEVPSNSP